METILSSQTKNEAVLRCEKFVEERLKVDLQKILDKRDVIYSQVSQHMELRNNIELVQKQTEAQGKMTSMVNMGCNFFAKASVTETKYIYVSIGLGFHAQLTPEEAFAFIDRKEAMLNKRADGLTEEANMLKARIKLLYQGMHMLIGAS
eukprot:TRINITY_DN16719_c0_g1_i1.p2 TRINITY_DN16719_c0_g1~~TRINITY_DN16719_c0_g1_i1.p2  ORF type:complete len:149 (+),score=41.97 TRINITY_DN16719_c0_g1_i1:184-630(+)